METTTSPTYTHLATVGRWSNIPVRRGPNGLWISQPQVHLAYYHAGRNVYDVRALPDGPLPAMAPNGTRQYRV